MSFMLKIMRSYESPTKVYRDVPQDISEETHFIQLHDTPIIQRAHTKGPIDANTVVHIVVSGEIVVFVHANESAFLLNAEGKTLQVINKVH